MGINKDKQTTQDNRYQPIHPQGTSDITRGKSISFVKTLCGIQCRKVKCV